MTDNTDRAQSGRAVGWPLGHLCSVQKVRLERAGPNTTSIISSVCCCVIGTKSSSEWSKKIWVLKVVSSLSNHSQVTSFPFDDRTVIKGF